VRLNSGPKHRRGIQVGQRRRSRTENWIERDLTDLIWTVAFDISDKQVFILCNLSTFRLPEVAQASIDNQIQNLFVTKIEL
jgi:hypothetical protein